ncbi:MAG: hypothetical protein AAGI22_10175 [Planctomycetota bacterium]
MLPVVDDDEQAGDGADDVEGHGEGRRGGGGGPGEPAGRDATECGSLGVGSAAWGWKADRRSPATRARHRGGSPRGSRADRPTRTTASRGSASAAGWPRPRRAERSRTWAAPPCRTPRRAGTSRTSSAGRRSRSGSRGRCCWTARTASARSSCPWRPRRGRSSPRRLGGWRWRPRAAASGRASCATSCPSTQCSSIPPSPTRSRRQRRRRTRWSVSAASFPGITSHGRLERVETDVLGRRLVLRLLFGTGDAIGINMAAHGAELCSADLAQRTGAVERYVHGQDVEKRANARALVEGRGRSVLAETVVPREVLAERARTTPDAMVRVLATYAVGYAHLGTQNWTLQAANTIAAVFLACGQDVAYVTECATGLLDFDVTKGGDLHASLTLPTMLVGTVGGGSGQGTAAEALAIMGCEGAGKARTLAEIVAGTVLAGDLSLVAAFASHEFVASHERLGRNRPANRADGR